MTRRTPAEMASHRLAVATRKREAAAARSITRETGGRWSLSCGDWITDQEAAPILAARGDST